MTAGQPTYFEFFAGGGMARAGLGLGWDCVFANDLSPMKAQAYAENWGADHLVRGDVAALTTADLPGRADLAWASFPCQDLSLAGGHHGLGESGAARMTRSGTFWPFWRLMGALKAERRAPRMIVLENVSGILTSHGGRDFAAIGEALAGAGYRFGAVVVDAVRFVPQSRPRVFFVAVEAGCAVPDGLATSDPSAAWHPRALTGAVVGMSARARAAWAWWSLPETPRRTLSFADVIEDRPTGARWHAAAETERLVALMAPLHQAKLREAKAAGRRRVGGLYRRTRPDGRGGRSQRAEVRFDDVAGCLRTPSGGSSRQTILVVEGEAVRSRLLSPREAARLMGLPDDYRLPPRSSDAYHLAGDGVCVPAVRFLAQALLEPILSVAPSVAGSRRPPPIGEALIAAE